jgi:hypothetical protein
MRATVTIANVSWNTMKTYVGIVPVSVSGVMPLRPTFPRPPISPPLASSSKARLYAYRNQTTGTIAIAMKLIIIMLSTLLARTMPP